MKKFGIVLEFELKEYFKNKTFMVTTLLIAFISVIVLFLPRVFDMSGILGIPSAGTESTAQESAPEVQTNTMAIMDPNNLVSDDMLKEYFPGTEWKKAESKDQMTSLIQNNEADAGFSVKSLTEYDYFVNNKGMMDDNEYQFEQVLSAQYQKAYCEKNNLNYKEWKSINETPITVNEQILGKDTMSNYWYAYGLVIISFMVIMLYGQMIAVAVTNEKSNRSIEVLVTTTTPKSLLFGKVIAGTLASLFQVGIVMGAILASYQINRKLWGGMLDMVFHIPTEVLITFLLFGVGGFVFYAFIYGSIGALVSKTEDISKSSSGVLIMSMLVYFIVMFQLMNVDGIPMKVLSYLPFSSYSAMVARVALSNVSVWEIVVSFIILVVSTVLVGFLGAKIYRMGTLRYGNPIKFMTAIKESLSGK